MEQLFFRQATRSDGAEVLALVQSVLEEYGLEVDSATTDADLHDIEASYIERGGWFEVLVASDGKIVGSGGLMFIDESTCELRKMYLVPEVRGHGWGKKMLVRFLKKAEILGFQRVTLETATVLVEALKLYTQFGFQPFTPDHMSCRCDLAYELWL